MVLAQQVVTTARRIEVLKTLRPGLLNVAGIRIENCVGS
jgi:hypothetical protein